MGKHRLNDPKQAAREAAYALKDPEATPDSIFSRYDTDAIWELFQELTCPTPCVGHVNQTGWHQECQRRAQAAMRELGFTPPGLDPTPESTKDDWDF